MHFMCGDSWSLAIFDGFKCNNSWNDFNAVASVVVGLLGRGAVECWVLYKTRYEPTADPDPTTTAPPQSVQSSFFSGMSNLLLWARMSNVQLCVLLNMQYILSIGLVWAGLTRDFIFGCFMLLYNKGRVTCLVDRLQIKLSVDVPSFTATGRTGLTKPNLLRVSLHD